MEETDRTGTLVADRYRVGEVLGIGGMGTVYSAFDKIAGRDVALKILRPHLGGSDEAGARFHREAFVGSKVHHPNCVGVDDLGWCDDGAIYLVMEVIRGESLAQVLEREGKLPWKRALHIARHVLRGLAHAHDQGIVHRDIKPDNLFVTGADGDPDFTRVLDFGIAKLAAGVDDGPALTAQGITIGTPDYLSPEQAQGVPLDGRSDVYSVSVVLFEMLTGKPPFADPELVKILMAHATAPVPKMEADADVPAPVEALVRDGLAKKPVERIASATAYIERIDALLADPKDTVPEGGVVLDGRYRLDVELGRGAWGRVFRGTHLGLGRTVAVKLLEPQHLADDDARRRFEREAQSSARLRHPNCVSVTDYGATADGGRYLAMELADGVRLDELLDRENRLTMSRAVHVMRHMLRGLAHAHGLGLVHRDLKPPNIMLCTEGADRDFARILDFGLARMVEGNDRITRTGIVCGTPRYMAPEQALDRLLDGRTDLYAASVIFFEMIAGRTPYDGDGAAELIKQHVNAPIPRIAEVTPGVVVPTAVEDLIRRGLAKSPDDRPASAEKYLADLERACSGDRTIELSMLDPAVIAAPPPPPRPAVAAPAPPAPARAPLLARFTRKQLTIAAAALGVVVIGLIAAIAGSSSSSSSSSKPAPSAEVTDNELEIEPEDVPRIDPDVAAALKLGGEKGAEKLRALRKERPDDATIPYALGRVYNKLGWPSQTVEAYRGALRLDDSYRDDAQLIRDLVALLASKSTWQQAAAVLEQDVGAPAVPALTTTAKKHKDSVVRARAAKLRDKLK